MWHRSCRGRDSSVDSPKAVIVARKTRARLHAWWANSSREPPRGDWVGVKRSWKNKSCAVKPPLPLKNVSWVENHPLIKKSFNNINQSLTTCNFLPVVTISQWHFSGLFIFTGYNTVSPKMHLTSNPNSHNSNRRRQQLQITVWECNVVDQPKQHCYSTCVTCAYWLQCASFRFRH